MKKFMSKKVNVFGKAVPVFAIAILGLALVSAALIPYFGQITGNVAVSQGLYLDGHAYNSPVTYSMEMTSLQSAVHSGVHTLKNNASVNATNVTLSTKCKWTVPGNNCDGIDTTYWIPSIYNYSASIGAQNRGNVSINVTDLGNGWLLWNYTAENTSEPHFRAQPKMTVAINYPNGFAVTTFDDGSHTGWYIAYDNGTTIQFSPSYTSGSYGNLAKVGENGNSLWVEINKSALGSSFQWHGYANFYDAPIWITPTTTASGDGSVWDAGVINASFLQPLTMPFTVPANSEMNFTLMTSFPKMLVPDTYTVTTQVTI